MSRMLRSLLVPLLAVAVLTGGPPSAVAGAPARPAEGGPPRAFRFEDDRITESSGLAASRRHRDVYWTHNDSGYAPTRIYAVDGVSGDTVATVTLQGVTGRDLEAVSLGPDGRIYVGDIGDNRGGTWPEVWIYRFPEPKRLRDVTLTPERFTVRYEDGPRDAEALMVHPRTGEVYIASKSNEGEGRLYRGPRKLVPTGSGVNTFRPVDDLDLEVTDGAFSPDGTRLVLRGYFTGVIYQWRTTGRGGRLGEDLGRLRVPLQRQGESVTFAQDGQTLMLGSEGAHSTVEPVELRGDQLPQSATPQEGGDAGRDGNQAVNDEDDGSEPNAVSTLIAVLTAGLLLLAGWWRRRRA